jgi:hypothetical protein
MPNPKFSDLNLFSLFTNPLNENQIDYMVTGSVAAMVYGEPRLTHDMGLPQKQKNTYETLKPF